jgi:hypothetical protein
MKKLLTGLFWIVVVIVALLALKVAFDILIFVLPVLLVIAVIVFLLKIYWLFKRKPL